MTGGTGANDYIGRQGDLFYDPEDGKLRISDGKAGGRPVFNEFVGSYRGFQAGCNQFLNTDYTNIVQIFIHDAEAKVDYIDYTDNTSNDDFYVTSLRDVNTDSSSARKIIALNLYGANTPDKTTGISTDVILAFVKKFIDMTLFDEFDEPVNNIDTIKNAFYANIDTIVAALPGGTLQENFTFDDGGRVSWPEYNGPDGNVTANFKIITYPTYAGTDYSYNNTVVFSNSGTGYKVGDQIVINGEQMYGVDGVNDFTLTVTGLKSGHITGLTMTSAGTGFHPHSFLGTTYTNYDANLIGGSGDNARIHVRSCDSNGVIIDYELTDDGISYVVGDILTLDYGDTVATFEVTSVGTDGIFQYDRSGQTYVGSPHRVQNGYWPVYDIDNGGNQQYYGGNFMSTDSSTSTYFADVTNRKLTLTSTIKGGIQLQPGMRGIVRFADNPYVFSAKLVSQATDNGNIWYIDNGFGYQTGVKVRFDNIQYSAGQTNYESNEFNGGAYTVVYDKSIFAMITTEANINSFYYNGYTGYNDHGYKKISTIMGLGEDFSARQIPQTYLYQSYYILRSSDAGRHVYYGSGGGNNIRVPTEAECSFPLGTVITIVSASDGITYIGPNDGNITKVWGAGFDQATSWYIPANSTATLLKIGSEKWMLSGVGLAVD